MHRTTISAPLVRYRREFVGVMSPQHKDSLDLRDLRLLLSDGTFMQCFSPTVQFKFWLIRDCSSEEPLD